jgi:hypothetical protein
LPAQQLGRQPPGSDVIDQPLAQDAEELRADVERDNIDCGMRQQVLRVVAGTQADFDAMSLILGPCSMNMRLNVSCQNSSLPHSSPGHFPASVLISLI